MNLGFLGFELQSQAVNADHFRELPRGDGDITDGVPVFAFDENLAALGVDRLQGQEEVVLKALSRPLDLVPGLAGVTILGNGRPIFILDVPRLLA